MDKPMPSLTQNRRFEVTKPISIGTYDIDFAGHVSNIVYFRWLEDMRLKVFDQYFPLKGFMDQGLLPVIAAHTIEYKRAIRLFDKPIAHMWIQEVRAASVIFHGEILVDDVVTTFATHTGVFINGTTMKPVRTPKIIAEQFRDN
jgi:acyl-CoA thioester hydrolase